MGIIRCRRVRLMIQASDRESTIAPSKPSLRQLSRSVSFPAFGSLASTKTHSPKPATSSTPTQRESITFTIQLTSYIQILLHVLPYLTPLTQTTVTPLDPIASAPQLSCSTPCKRLYRYTTPHHPRSVKVDR